MRLAAALLIASAVGATPAHALVLPRAELEAANGYKVVIDGFGDQVAVTAKSQGSGATYAATGTVEGDHLSADLGPFGGVALQFVPAEAPREVGRRGCRGGVVEQTGLWHGTISFVAEHGFTSAFTSVAEGEVVRLRQSCRTAGRGLEAAAALHARRRGERGVVFSAFELEGRKSLVSAIRAHTEEGVRVVDFARDRTGPSGLRIDRERGRARVSPHPPFTGHARFNRGAGLRQHWRGNLAVRFPSGRLVRLAGPRFNALIGGEEVAIGVASIEGLLGIAI